MKTANFTKKRWSCPLDLRVHPASSTQETSPKILQWCLLVAIIQWNILPNNLQNNLQNTIFNNTQPLPNACHLYKKRHPCLRQMHFHLCRGPWGPVFGRWDRNCNRFEPSCWGHPRVGGFIHRLVVKLDHFHRDSGENKKYLKPTPLS